MSVVADIKARLTLVDGLLIKSATAVDDDLLRQARSPRSPSIAFHIWHCARWADRLQAHLPRMLRSDLRVASGEIWETDDLASLWGLRTDALGGFATGMGMDEGVSATLPLPAREALLAYASRAFAAAEQVVERLSDADLLAQGTDLYDRTNTVATVVLSHVTHINRHLGMIEALRGVEGQKGSATV